jgi:hypothetical protein
MSYWGQILICFFTRYCQPAFCQQLVFASSNVLSILTCSISIRTMVTTDIACSTSRPRVACHLSNDHDFMK